MQRDMEIVRTILLTIEDTDDPSSCLQRIHDALPEVSPEVIDEYLTMLEQHGLIEIKSLARTLSNVLLTALLKLTWEGHDFIAAAKNESVWKKMLEALKEKGYGEAANAPFALIKSLLMNIANGG